ncbi:MAG: hypothetical protein ACOX4E_08610 [Anaerovoracaceae bacterium]|jgi:hypothetical protein
MNRKILFILIGVVMLISSMGMAFAEESAGSNFADMPDNWSTDALQKAVSNGLLGGCLACRRDGESRQDGHVYARYEDAAERRYHASGSLYGARPCL